ncbi:MAG: molybdopterin-dependent oxidoreductase [Verrucomicrobia bacterium]|nr:molybdopterin-dependent oxidoreductase [Verrucomicrobiota bacterium]
MEPSATLLEQSVSRRSFLKMTSGLAAGTAFAGAFFRVDEAKAANFGNPVLVETNPRVEIKYSVCQGCQGRCGIKCKIVDGVLVKIEGNPYNPANLEQHLPYTTDSVAAGTTTARLCAKGLGGIQSLYDPYRLKQPLKRVGPRGAGQWEAISWDQAFSEIAAKLSQYRDLTTPMDPKAPELGKKVNQVVFSPGRNQQAAFTDLFWKKVFGTINAKIDHTSICEESRHVAHDLFTGSGIQGSKNFTEPDLAAAEWVLWFGSDPCSANFPFTAIARKTIEFVQRGGKLYLVDPRCNVAASKGTWIPVKLGADAAVALAMGRHIVDNNLYKAAFLPRPHDAAANPTGELNVTDATFLVKIVNGHPLAFLRASEAGIAGGAASDFVVWSSGAAVKFNTVDTADLLPGAVTVNGFTCKTAFELYVERVREKTLEQYSAICGVPVATLQKLGNELAAAGRRGCVTMYRGSVQHTNGTYAALAILDLNLLVGNPNWKGGTAFGGGGWADSYTGAPFDPNAVPGGGVTASGVQITRAGSKYEDSAEFGSGGYPARRPWFPLAFYNNYQELIPSIEDEYPYPVKALILYWNGIPYSTPAARAAYERVMSAKVGDEYKLPLVVAIDIAMGEATEWADYVLPDTTYFERWTTVGLPSTVITKNSGVRQPVVGSVDPATGDYTGVLPNTKTLEDILLGIAHAMGLPTGLRNAWDYWRKPMTNLAAQDGGPGVDHVLARGGRFEDYTQAYEGEKQRRRFGGRLFFFSERLASTRDSMTGQYFDGLGKYEPIADVLGNPVDTLDAAFPLQLITYKLAWHTQMHTIRYPWLVSIQAENFVEINPTDATPLNLRTGDRARVTSASAPQGIEGLVRVTGTVAPGVVAVAHHFGHWAMSSRLQTVNGAQTAYDPSRGAGLQAAPIMRADPQLPNVTLQDKIGGSAAFYDTRVQVVKI